MSVRVPVQVVVPMAGAGSRFTEVGYSAPKPLLPVHGVPMYRLVVANLLTPCVSSITIIAQREWELESDIRKLDQAIAPEVRLIEIDHVTDGPATTVGLALGGLRPDLPVVTGNSDQYVDADLSPFFAQLEDPRLSGSILTMGDSDPKWSYVSLDESGHAELIREKEVISPFATVGIYAFSSAALMAQAFQSMRQANDTVNGEYYVGPSFNHLIARDHVIGVHHLGPIATVMHGLGIPRDYEEFLEREVSLRAATRAQSLFDNA